MAAADRDLLFGLLALQNGLIDQGQLVAAFQAWTRDKARPLADHLSPTATSTPTSAPRWRPWSTCTSRSTAATPRRAWRPWPSAARPASAWPASATPTWRPRSPTSAPGPARDERPRSHRQLRRRRRHLRRPAVPRPAARTPGAAWAPSSWPSTRSCTARWRSSRSSTSMPTTREPPALPAGGRDHRRAGAPRDRAGLRPGHLRRRPALLRHAVHPGDSSRRPSSASTPTRR